MTLFDCLTAWCGMNCLVNHLANIMCVWCLAIQILVLESKGYSVHGRNVRRPQEGATIQTTTHAQVSKIAATNTVPPPPQAQQSLSQNPSRSYISIYGTLGRGGTILDLLKRRQVQILDQHKKWSAFQQHGGSAGSGSGAQTGNGTTSATTISGGSYTAPPGGGTYKIEEGHGTQGGSGGFPPVHTSLQSGSQGSLISQQQVVPMPDIHVKGQLVTTDRS